MVILRYSSENLSKDAKLKSVLPKIFTTAQNTESGYFIISNNFQITLLDNVHLPSNITSAQFINASKNPRAKKSIFEPKNFGQPRVGLVYLYSINYNTVV